MSRPDRQIRLLRSPSRWRRPERPPTSTPVYDGPPAASGSAPLVGGSPLSPSRRRGGLQIGDLRPVTGPRDPAQVGLRPRPLAPMTRRRASAFLEAEPLQDSLRIPHHPPHAERPRPVGARGVCTCPIENFEFHFKNRPSSSTRRRHGAEAVDGLFTPALSPFTERLGSSGLRLGSRAVGYFSREINDIHSAYPNYARPIQRGKSEEAAETPHQYGLQVPPANSSSAFPSDRTEEQHARGGISSNTRITRRNSDKTRMPTPVCRLPRAPQVQNATLELRSQLDVTSIMSQWHQHYCWYAIVPSKAAKA